MTIAAPRATVFPDPQEPAPDPARPLLAWLLAGEARFTVVSEKTGNHIVVAVSRTRRPEDRHWSWFVRGRGGSQDPDEGESPAASERIGGPWFYIGQLYAPSGVHGYVKVVPTAGTSPRGHATLSVVNWVMRRIHAGWDGTGTTVPARLLKSVKCARCKRLLLDPASIARGLGPECWEKRQGGD